MNHWTDNLKDTYDTLPCYPLVLRVPLLWVEESKCQTSLSLVQPDELVRRTSSPRLQ